VEDFIDDDIVLLINGNDAVVKLIYAKYHIRIYNLALRFLKDRDLASEIVQETFIKLWINRSKLDASGNLWLYLFVIAKRLSLNKLREINRSQNLFDQLVSRIEKMHNPTEEAILEKDLLSFTEKIVSTLPQQQQKVYRLSRQEGFTHKEIASQLQISSSTVNNQLTEALKKLRTELKYCDLFYLIILFLYK
jgi:RNA polymerase sigma-70 factor (family 1)